MSEQPLKIGDKYTDIEGEEFTIEDLGDIYVCGHTVDGTYIATTRKNTDMDNIEVSEKEVNEQKGFDVDEFVNAIPQPKEQPPTINICGCSRCGKDHPKIPHNLFRGIPIGDSNGWAICPETGDPILIRQTLEKIVGSPIEYLQKNLDKQPTPEPPTITRYGQYPGDTDIMRIKDGDYVLYEDYRAELQALRQSERESISLLLQWKNESMKLDRKVVELNGQVADLKAEVERLRHDNRGLRALVETHEELKAELKAELERLRKEREECLTRYMNNPNNEGSDYE